MTRIESFLGCAALLGSLGVALYAGEARSETPPIYCPGIIVPTIYGSLVCTANVQFGGGTASGPSTPVTRTVTVSPPTPPTPPTPPSDNCGPKGEGGHHGHHGGPKT